MMRYYLRGMNGGFAPEPGRFEDEVRDLATARVYDSLLQARIGETLLPGVWEVVSDEDLSAEAPAPPAVVAAAV